MEDGAGDAEEVEDAVDVAVFGADAVQNGAESVGETAEEEQQDAGKAHVLVEGFDADEDAPAVQKVADDFGDLEAVGVDGGEGDADDSDEGDEGEEPLAESTADAEEGDRGVGAEDEEEDVAMVDDAEDLFAGEAAGEGVVDARDDVEDDHGRAEDGDGDVFEGGVGFDDHENGCDDGKNGGEAVADGVPEFLGEGIFRDTDRHKDIITKSPPYGGLF